jgi:quinoprotein glucose dehydrogenase
VAWIFHTGDVSNGEHTTRKSGFESTPIVVDGVMYVSTPFNRVIALNPVTGVRKWAYDPKIDLKGYYFRRVNQPWRVYLTGQRAQAR